jgi:hypothetical protein
MRHRCDSRIINYLTLMTLKTPEMTGTKSMFRSKFRFQLYSVPATGQNFAGILNLGGKSGVWCESKQKLCDTAFWHLQALFCERTIGSPLVLDRWFSARRHLLLSFVLIPFGLYLGISLSVVVCVWFCAVREMWVGINTEFIKCWRYLYVGWLWHWDIFTYGVVWRREWRVMWKQAKIAWHRLLAFKSSLPWEDNRESSRIGLPILGA